MRKFCPTCHEDLTEVERFGIILDSCCKCQGVWLEYGDLEQVVQSVQDVPPVPVYPKGSKSWRNIFLYTTQVRRVADDNLK